MVKKSKDKDPGSGLEGRMNSGVVGPDGLPTFKVVGKANKKYTKEEEAEFDDTSDNDY
jgi:hypothetical protein